MIRNIGSSPAFDINVDYKITKNDNTVTDYHWNNSLLQPQEKVKLLLDDKWIDNFYKNNKRLDVNIRYTDKEGGLFQEQFSCSGLIVTLGLCDIFLVFSISKNIKNVNIV